MRKPLPPKTLHALEDLYCTGNPLHFEGRNDALVHLYMALRGPRDPNAYDDALDLLASFNEPEPDDALKPSSPPAAPIPDFHANSPDFIDFLDCGPLCPCRHEPAPEDPSRAGAPVEVTR